jgi:hypothetical protein
MESLTLAAGIVIYNNDLSLLKKCLLGLKNQIFNSLNVEIEIGIIDNTEGAQIEAVGRIAAMETSKFWKLRSIWFKLRRFVGIKGE